MPLPSCPSLVFAVLFSLHFTSRLAFAQNCYYPNGDVAEGMAACTSEGGSCCPLNWSCLSNGLCYLENADYFGRYTCTDQDWASDSQCPNYCTQNNTAAGNEAIQHCRDDSWCCDSNRDPKRNCCNNRNAEVLDLDSASEIGFISSTASPSSVSKSSSSSSSSSTTTSSRSPVTITSTSTSSSSSSSTDRATPTTITSSEVTSNSAGIATTIISVITSTPTPTTTPTPASDSSNRSLVVGLGAGIPGGLLAAGAIIFLLWRLRRKRQLHEKPPLSEPSGLVSMYRSPDDTPELDSTLPASNTDRKSELYGSTPSQNPHSPAISSMTGNSEQPPYYSPTSGIGPGGGGGGGGGLGQVQEEEPAELWGSEIPAQQWPGQQPYRAPEPEQRMSQTFRVSGQDFAPYRPPPKGEGGVGDVLGGNATRPRDY